MHETKLYVFTQSSHCLHIRELCPVVKNLDQKACENGWEFFSSENEALAKYGKQMKSCEACDREKDRILMDYINKKRGLY